MNLEAFVLTLVTGDDRRIADQRVVDARIRDKVGLELVQIDVQGAIESEGRRDGADHLGYQTVEVFVVWTRDVQVAAADIVHRLIIDEECAI